jgi:isochorismate synthase
VTFFRALARAVELPRELDALTVVSGASEIDPESLLESASVVWDSRERSEVAPELTVGIGSTAELTDADLLAQGAASLAWKLRRVGDAGPRWFGGFAFDSAALGAFSAFGAARFRLPRWTLTRDAGGTRLSLAVFGVELRHGARLAEEARALAAGVRKEPARARVASDGRAAFLVAVRAALEAIGRGELEKVVVVRELRLAGPFSSRAVLAALAGQPSTVRFAFGVGESRFLGATPELLVRYDGARVTSEAVAGTYARTGNEREDVAALFGSEKDRREHAFVVDHVRARLRALGATLDVEREPEVRSLRRMHHLVTPVNALLRRAHVLDLVRALGPTPAVAGVPAEAAADFIRARERAERGWFAGPFGYFDAEGRGAFVVALRSALIGPNAAHLYAGAGIVRGSDPKLELAETELKLGTLLDALGARGARERVASVGGAP